MARRRPCRGPHPCRVVTQSQQLSFLFGHNTPRCIAIQILQQPGSLCHDTTYGLAIHFPHQPCSLSHIQNLYRDTVFCPAKPTPSHNTISVLRHTYPLAKPLLLSQYTKCIVTPPHRPSSSYCNTIPTHCTPMLQYNPLLQYTFP